MILLGDVETQSIGKELQHGFGVAMVTANPPVPPHVISQLMGHTDCKTTEIYLQALSEERHSLVMNVWDESLFFAMQNFSDGFRCNSVYIDWLFLSEKVVF